MGHVRRQNERCRIDGDRHADTEPIRPIGRTRSLIAGSSGLARAPTSPQPTPGEPDYYPDDHQEQQESQPPARVICLSVGSQSNTGWRTGRHVISGPRLLLHGCEPGVQSASFWRTDGSAAAAGPLLPARRYSLDPWHDDGRSRHARAATGYSRDTTRTSRPTCQTGGGGSGLRGRR